MLYRALILSSYLVSISGLPAVQTCTTSGCGYTCDTNAAQIQSILGLTCEQLQVETTAAQNADPANYCRTVIPDGTPASAEQYSLQTFGITSSCKVTGQQVVCSRDSQCGGQNFDVCSQCPFGQECKPTTDVITPYTASVCVNTICSSSACGVTCEAPESEYMKAFGLDCAGLNEAVQREFQADPTGYCNRNVPDGTPASAEANALQFGITATCKASA